MIKATQSVKKTHKRTVRFNRGQKAPIKIKSTKKTVVKNGKRTMTRNGKRVSASAGTIA